MNINILHLIEGAKKAKGLTVIIDVFRAISVESYLTNNNAERIIPVSSVDFALDYKKNHPDAILIGERGGAIVPGFDYGNSPSQIENIDFTGKTVIHTTSAGTQGIANAAGADEIIGGSLVSAKAIAEYIKQKNPENVSLVCMGLAGQYDTKEDVLCAKYIKSILENEPLRSLDHHIATLKYTDGAKFFDESKQSIFPQRDFYLCTDCDKFDFVLKLEKDPETGLMSMHRIDIKYSLEKTQHTQVSSGDMMSKFTKQEVLAFPNDIKRKICYGDYKEPQGSFDAAIILGCNPSLLCSRAAAAAKLYHEGKCNLFITTGGVKWETEFGYISECEAISKYLEKMGVPSDLIITENSSTTTKQNFECSKAILSKNTDLSNARIAIVTSRYHLKRSVLLSQYYIPESQIVGVSAHYPNDSPELFVNDNHLTASVTTECRCLSDSVLQGIIPDFPIL